MKNQQRGISLFGLLFVGIVLAFGGVVGAQVVPTLIEYQAVVKAIKKVAAQGGTIPEIRTAFEKTQNIDDIIQDIMDAKISERGATRMDDRISEAGMEDRKKNGYF